MELNEINLNEVFDSDETNSYVSTNLMPKTKVPQMWNINAPGNDNLVVRMVSYLSKGDAIKQVKQGDKFVQVFLMSLSKTGNIAELRQGLGSDPIGTLNTIFDTVYQQVEKIKIDAVLFRFPAKKMKGQEKTLQRIIKRLAMQRTGGKFVVLEDLYQFTGKHAYVLIYRKNKPLEDISGIPGINAELYTKVESKVGDVYINDKTGKQVSKMEAIAGSIAAQENTRNERSVITKSKVSKRYIAMAKNTTSDEIKYSKLPELTDNVERFSNPATANPMNNQSVFENIVNSPAYKEKIGDAFSVELERIIKSPDLNVPFIKNIITKNKVTDSNTLQEIAEADVASIEDLKYEFIDNFIKDRPSLSRSDAETLALEAWRTNAKNMLSSSMQAYSDAILNELVVWSKTYDADRYKPTMKGAIRDYCGGMYEDISAYLLGKSSVIEDEEEDPEGLSEPVYQIDEDDVVKTIKRLDEAFEVGDRIPENTQLYRAQKFSFDLWDSTVASKVFYFRNFVSCSLYPIIFGGWSVDASSGVVDDEYLKPEVVRPESDDIKVISNDFVPVAWVISGADKINTVIPGELSHNSREVEVILPRGTTLEITKINNADSSGYSGHGAKLLEAKVVTNEELSESTVYDGDLFVETGEVKPLSGFCKFLSEYKQEKPTSANMLAGIVDLTFVPEKFII